MALSPEQLLFLKLSQKFNAARVNGLISIPGMTLDELRSYLEMVKKFEREDGIKIGIAEGRRIERESQRLICIQRRN